jgi:hypothetical protein
MPRHSEEWLNYEIVVRYVWLEKRDETVYERPFVLGRSGRERLIQTNNQAERASKIVQSDNMFRDVHSSRILVVG